ncbi:MAG: cytidine deaminase [Sediminibacterium sp.]|nr:cytidine deaminase [Sediminibacterium sp.]
MKTLNYHFDYIEYNDIHDLDTENKTLFKYAQAAFDKSYSPYSNFKVGVATLLANQQIISGSNQENASYPVGICAERVILSSASVQFPHIPIVKMAITYFNIHGENNYPISPCGICRQSLVEHEQFFKSPIIILLGGITGKVWEIARATYLLPFGFTKEDLIKK